MLDRIRHAVGIRERSVNARSTEVREVDVTTAFTFFDANHLQGRPTQHTYSVGLYEGDRLIQCLSVGRPSRAHVGKDATLELKRLASLPGLNVRGGASRLLRRAVSWALENRYGQLLSYCDLRYGTGRVYEKLGFTLVRTSRPSYWYVKGHRRFSALAMRKTPAERTTGKTEHELRADQGYARIWDCGHQVWRIELGT